MLIRSLSAPARGREVASVMTLTLLLSTYQHLLDPLRPRQSIGPGYLGWWDQSQYLGLARILASGRLPEAGEFTYGLGFPLIGVPGVWLDITDPFIVPDLVMAAVAMAALYVAVLRMVNRWAAVISVAFVLTLSPMLTLTVVPWSSNVILCCVSLGLLAISMPQPPTNWRFAALGALTGFAFASRYADVVLIAGLVLVALLLDRTGRRLIHAVAAAVPAAVIVGAVLAVHWIVLGSPFRTPYAQHMRGVGENATSDQSLAQYQITDIPVHFWESFITGTTKGGAYGTPMFHYAPWLALVPLGMVLVFLRRDRWFSLHVVMIPVTVLLSLLYLAFAAGGGADVIYGNARYWLPMLPYWAMLAVLAAAAVADWATASRPRAQPEVETTVAPVEAAPVAQPEPLLS